MNKVKCITIYMSGCTVGEEVNSSNAGILMSLLSVHMIIDTHADTSVGWLHMCHLSCCMFAALQNLELVLLWVL